MHTDSTPVYILTTPRRRDGCSSLVERSIAGPACCRLGQWRHRSRTYLCRLLNFILFRNRRYSRIDSSRPASYKDLICDRQPRYCPKHTRCGFRHVWVTMTRVSSPNSTNWLHSSWWISVVNDYDHPISYVEIDTVCSNGISGIQVGDACCRAGCTQCGGTKCSTNTGTSGYGAAECCVDTIISAGVECGGDVVAPCISYGESPGIFNRSVHSVETKTEKPGFLLDGKYPSVIYLSILDR